MIFKKPYAFFIKYFRVINLMLVLFMIFLSYKMNILHQTLNDVFMGSLTNFSNLESNYIGFILYFALFIISVIIIIIIITLKRKEKPFKDYLFNIIYNVFILAYFLSVSNLFLNLENSVVEQTTLKLYSDISLLIMIPLLYFIIKYILIVIAFDLKKFNFKKDIIEIKQTEKDNEEIELIFDKHTYKIKRGIRKYFRELKYYVLENKMFISIIIGALLLLGLISVLSINMFNSNKVNMKENFNAGNFTFKINSVYETQYDLNYNMIDKDNKYVIVNVNVTNNYIENQSIDFNRIRILFDNDYVYANNHFNKFFYDLGKPYNNEILNTGESYNFIFIFNVPNNYKSNKYIIKFYDRLEVKDEQSIGSYKELNVKATKLDKDRKVKNSNFNNKFNFNKKNYGNSSILLSNYSIESNYIYNDGTKTKVIRDNNVNNVLLILGYKLEIDQNSILYNYFDNDKYFFNNFISIEYYYNEKVKICNNIKVIDIVDNKVMLSVPYQIKDATNINLIINFRDTKIVYKLK